MKAFLLQCTFITTLCLAAQFITATPIDNSKYLPEKYFSLKRTKPSLSIANPLDVLRQRVILEMARRQREKAIQQADINREILRTIGKRGNSLDYNDIEDYMRGRYFDVTRGYIPMYQPNHGGLLLNKMDEQQRQIHSNNGNIQKANGKIENENKLTSNGNSLNEGNQEQIYLIDDANNSNNNNNNNMEDDDETQVKYLYSLLKNRTPNSI